MSLRTRLCRKRVLPWMMETVSQEPDTEDDDSVDPKWETWSSKKMSQRRIDEGRHTGNGERKRDQIYDQWDGAEEL